MKYVFYVLLGAVVGMIAACSENDLQVPNTRENQLALVVMQPKDGSKTLLLENGTVANPISGLPNFKELGVGLKLLLDYKVGDTYNSITNIEVTNFVEARDSTFVINVDSTNLHDTLFLQDFSGTFFIANADSSETYKGDVSFSFGEQNTDPSEFSYEITVNNGLELVGTGFFTIDKGLITFSNTDEEKPYIPHGSYSYSLFSGRLYIWSVNEEGTLAIYSLQSQ